MRYEETGGLTVFHEWVGGSYVCPDNPRMLFVNLINGKCAWCEKEPIAPDKAKEQTTA